MARATEDRISRSLRSPLALEREARLRAAQPRRLAGFLYLTSLATLGVIAAAPAVFASAPKELARSVIGGVGVVARGLRDSIGLAEGEDGPDAKPSIGPEAAPAGSKPAGLRIIVSASSSAPAPCSRRTCPPARNLK